MRVLGAIILHYGSDYLEYVIESIYDSVDKILIVYTSTPSHGSGSSLNCPDTEDELRALTRRFGDKIIWESIRRVQEENRHRQIYIDYAINHKFDQVLVADSDEVYDPKGVKGMLEEAAKLDSSHVGVGGDRWFHFWKSFNEVNRDGFYPIRIHNVNKQPSREPAIIHTGAIYHMGYTISETAMRYKLSCHGHKSEFKHDWLNTWLTYTKEAWDEYIDKHWKRGEDWTLHPVSRDVWIKTEPFDKTTLPEFMRKHPLYEL